MKFIIISIRHVYPLHMARHPYNVLTTVAQQINPTYDQMSLQHIDRSRTTKTNLLPSYATLAS